MVSEIPTNAAPLGEGQRLGAAFGVNADPVEKRNDIRFGEVEASAEGIDQLLAFLAKPRAHHAEKAFGVDIRHNRFGAHI
jgi:hypothetical protein